MSETMVKTYVTALNHLIRNQSRRLAGVKVVYWYSGQVWTRRTIRCRICSKVLGRRPRATRKTTSKGQPRKSPSAQGPEVQPHALLDAIRSGKRPELRDYRYYALTLSANSGRVVIRDWMEGQFTELLEAVNAWFDDLSIVHRDGAPASASHKFAAVLAAPLRDLADAPAPLTATLWRCASETTTDSASRHGTDSSCGSGST